VSKSSISNSKIMFSNDNKSHSFTGVEQQTRTLTLVPGTFHNTACLICHIPKRASVSAYLRDVLHSGLLI